MIGANFAGCAFNLGASNCVSGFGQKEIEVGPIFLGSWERNRYGFVSAFLGNHCLYSLCRRLLIVYAKDVQIIMVKRVMASWVS
jgi:hypothetical protein